MYSVTRLYPHDTSFQWNKEISPMPRSIQFRAFGGPEVLEIVEVECPAPKSDEVLVRVKALGLNYTDALRRRDPSFGNPSLPASLGYEAAGIVAAVGKDIAHVKVGDAVNVLPVFDISRYATYGEMAVVPGRAIIRQPEGLSFEQGASIWAMFLTLYSAISDDAGIIPGEHVVVTAASSSVGIAAIQLLNLKGAVPVAFTRTREKQQKLLDAGARHVVAYREVDAVEEIMRITDGSGIRVIFDSVGGDFLATLMQMAAVNGLIYVFGASGGDQASFPLATYIRKMLTLKGWTPRKDLFLDDESLARAVAFISEAVRSGKLTPALDRVFDFTEIVAAHRYLESGRQFGKIVVRV